MRQQKLIQQNKKKKKKKKQERTIKFYRTNVCKCTNCKRSRDAGISQLFPINVLDMQSGLLAADISQQILFLRVSHFPQTSPAAPQLISWQRRRFANVGYNDESRILQIHWQKASIDSSVAPVYRGTSSTGGYNTRPDSLEKLDSANFHK